MTTQCLQLYFQPKIDVNNESVIGYEILLRNKEKSPCYPATKMETVFHDQVKHACFLKWMKKELQQLLKVHPEVSLSINFAPQQLLYPETKTFLRDMKAYSEQLEIEITEEMPLLDSTEQISTQQVEKEISTMLAFIQAEGYLISLDDVGTGQNSLERALSYAPFLNQIKFSLIKYIHQNASAEMIDAFLEAWHQFAKDHHLDVVVEGIEDEDTSEKLKDAGLNLQQGYYFGKPAAKLLFHS